MYKKIFIMVIIKWWQKDDEHELNYDSNRGICLIALKPTYMAFKFFIIILFFLSFSHFKTRDKIKTTNFFYYRLINNELAYIH